MKKSKFDPKRKYEAIESYLNRLEEEISSLDYKVGYSNLTKGERDAVYSLQNDNSVIIKEADKGCLQFLSGTERTALKRQKANSMIKMFISNLQEVWKVLLRKSSKLSSNSEIGEMLPTIH